MRKGAALRLVIEDDRGEQSLAVFAGDDPIPPKFPQPSATRETSTPV